MHHHRSSDSQTKRTDLTDFPEADMNAVIGTAAAIRAHLTNPVFDEPATTEEIHQLWNEWPARPEPISWTLAALFILQREGHVQSIEHEGQLLWMRARTDIDPVLAHSTPAIPS